MVQVSVASTALMDILEILKAGKVVDVLASLARVTTTSTPTPSETVIGQFQRLTKFLENSPELRKYD